jgi:hypothetical protein
MKISPTEGVHSAAIKIPSIIKTGKSDFKVNAEKIFFMAQLLS